MMSSRLSGRAAEVAAALAPAPASSFRLRSSSATGSPNCEVVKTGSVLSLHTQREVSAGEELSIDCSQRLRARRQQAVPRPSEAEEDDEMEQDDYDDGSEELEELASCEDGGEAEEEEEEQLAVQQQQQQPQSLQRSDSKASPRLLRLVLPDDSESDEAFNDALETETAAIVGAGAAASDYESEDFLLDGEMEEAQDSEPEVARSGKKDSQAAEAARSAALAAAAVSVITCSRSGLSPGSSQQSGPLAQSAAQQLSHAAERALPAHARAAGETDAACCRCSCCWQLSPGASRLADRRPLAARRHRCPALTAVHARQHSRADRSSMRRTLQAGGIHETE